VGAGGEGWEARGGGGLVGGEDLGWGGLPDVRYPPLVVDGLVFFFRKAVAVPFYFDCDAGVWVVVSDADEDFSACFDADFEEADAVA